MAQELSQDGLGPSAQIISNALKACIWALPDLPHDELREVATSAARDLVLLLADQRQDLCATNRSLTEISTLCQSSITQLLRYEGA